VDIHQVPAEARRDVSYFAQTQLGKGCKSKRTWRTAPGRLLRGIHHLHARQTSSDVTVDTVIETTDAAEENPYDYMFDEDCHPMNDSIDLGE
jgi:hypothetical protein